MHTIFCCHQLFLYDGSSEGSVGMLIRGFKFEEAIGILGLWSLLFGNIEANYTRLPEQAFAGAP